MLRNMKILLLTTVITLLSLQVEATPTEDVNAASPPELTRMESMFEEMVRIARLENGEAPPYDPSVPSQNIPIEEVTEAPSKNSSSINTPAPEESFKPYYPYYPYYDDKWRKCCKLENAKECCLKKAQDLPLYNLGTGMYYFHNDMSTAKNWFDALHFCRAHGLELASIETENENNMLKMYANWFLGGVYDFYSFYWTSLNDLGTEGTFTWAGTGQTSTYFTWHLSGQPDGGVWENCGEIWQTDASTILWNERDCLKWKGRFICEMPKPCYEIINASYE